MFQWFQLFQTFHPRLNVFKTFNRCDSVQIVQNVGIELASSCSVIPTLASFHSFGLIFLSVYGDARTIEILERLEPLERLKPI